MSGSAFEPEKGAARRFTCRACGYVVIERWHGSGKLDYSLETKDGRYESGCPKHPAGMRRGFHDNEVEVLSREVAA